MSRLRLALPLSMVLAAACGLISSDIASISFALPPKTYSFDTAKAGWNLPPANVPSVPCTDDATCCSVATLASIDCSRVICDGGSGTCALKVTVEAPPQTINLKKEAKGLERFDGQTVIDVTISKIAFDVPVNTLNVDLPPVELFVAPEGTTSTADPLAVRFGTVPSIPSQLPVTDGSVALDKAGQDAFVGFAHNFGTPFVFLARSTVVVPGGTPLPSGALEITVKGQLSAKPGF